MALILSIETSAKTCSVSLYNSNEFLGGKEAASDGYIHAESLHPFIKSVVEESGVRFDKLEAVAISKGPGSYTGLRIGVAAAKGMAYALKIPLLAIDTLQMMAVHAAENHLGFDFYIPMIDARRMEVYTNIFNPLGKAIEETTAIILDEAYFHSLPGGKLIVFGDGSEKCKEILPSDMTLINGICPKASQMNGLAQSAFEQRLFEDLAYFEPFYLKDFIPGLKKAL